MSATCRTCGQEMSGPDEPTVAGTMVGCSCGIRWIRQDRPGRVAPDSWWTRQANGTKGTSVRCSWASILTQHQMQGHTLGLATITTTPLQ